MEQDEEYVDKSSEVGKLILKINHLEKRPTLDNSLGEVLDSFLQSLKRSENFLKHGIFKINFAESALLLQSSALIYSKKVDLLWDMINDYQKRLISFKIEDNEIELKRIEERERKYRRRRKPIETPLNKEQSKSKSFHVDWEEINNFQHLHCEKDSKLYSDWYKKMVSKWDLQPTPNSKKSLADKQVQFRSPENAIFDQDQDNEFVVYTSKMESVIGLEEVLLPNKPLFNDFSFKLYSELYLIPKFLESYRFSYEDLDKHSLDAEKYIENYKDKYFRNSICDESYKESFLMKESPQKLGRISVCSTVVSRLDMSDLDNIYVKTCQENLTDEKVGIDCDFTNSSPHSLTGGKDVEDNVSLADNSLESIDCEGDKMVNKSGRTLRSASLKKIIEPEPKTKSTEAQAKKIRERRKSDDEIPEKRRRLSQAAIRKLATGISVDLEKFNSFFAAHYQPEEGEGQVEIQEFLFDDPIDSSSRIGLEDELPLSQLSDHPILCTQDSGYESHFQEHEDTYVDDIISPTSELDKQMLEEPLRDESFTVGDQSEKPLYQKVYEWKQYMSEKFKEMKTADFDIHKYGSNIMENFEESQPQKFSDIVKGKSAAEVTRFFISALQLANTSNVEIQGVQSGKLSNETFELKLISKERYYDRLKDYMAPSEQDYQERLSSANKMSKKRPVASSSGESNNYKRNKFV